VFKDYGIAVPQDLQRAPEVVNSIPLFCLLRVSNGTLRRQTLQELKIWLQTGSSNTVAAG